MFEIASLIVEAKPIGIRITFSNATRNQEYTTVVPHTYGQVLAAYSLKGWIIRNITQINQATTAVILQRKAQNRSEIDPNVKQLMSLLDQAKPKESKE